MAKRLPKLNFHQDIHAKTYKHGNSIVNSSRSTALEWSVKTLRVCGGGGGGGGGGGEAESRGAGGAA